MSARRRQQRRSTIFPLPLSNTEAERDRLHFLYQNEGAIRAVRADLVARGEQDDSFVLTGSLREPLMRELSERDRGLEETRRGIAEYEGMEEIPSAITALRLSDGCDFFNDLCPGYGDRIREVHQKPGYFAAVVIESGGMMTAAVSVY